jgi:hypothetical protein
LVTAVALWACCVAAVGLAFLVATRHATYRRAARPAEWGVLALAAQYLFLALARLHATHGTSSILVSRLETGLEADLGPLGRLAVVTALFAVIGGYVGVLLWHAHLSPFLKTLLGTSLMLFWYWGPCGVWGQDFVEVFLAVRDSGLAGDLSALVLWPSLPRILVPLVLMHWAVWHCPSPARWSLWERASLALFFAIAGLLYFHPAVQFFRASPWFLAELAFLAILANGFAAAVGWGLALVGRRMAKAGDSAGGSDPNGDSPAGTVKPDSSPRQR